MKNTAQQILSAYPDHSEVRMWARSMDGSKELFRSSHSLSLPLAKYKLTLQVEKLFPIKIEPTQELGYKYWSHCQMLHRPCAENILKIVYYIV